MSACTICKTPADRQATIGRDHRRVDGQTVPVDVVVNACGPAHAAQLMRELG